MKLFAYLVIIAGLIVYGLYVLIKRLFLHAKAASEACGGQNEQDSPKITDESASATIEPNLFGGTDGVMRYDFSASVTAESKPRLLSPEDFFKEHMPAYVAFDLETTGLDPANAQIIEIGAVKIVEGQEVDSFQTLVNPGCHIPEAATAINHITDAMVSSAPVYSVSVPRFADFMGDLPCVAHNASFDVKFLCAAFVSLGIEKTLVYADSLKMARQHFRGLENHKLGTVCQAIGYQIGQAHRALDDARAVNAIVQACFSRREQLAQCEPGYLRHMELAKKIEDDYRLAKDYADDDFCHMESILALCREDFSLVQQTREYHALQGWADPQFDSFRRAIIILSRRKDFDEAIAICQQAVALEIPDKGAGGMAGRMERLRAQQAADGQRQEKEQAMAERRMEKQQQREEKLAAQVAAPPAPSNKKRVLQYSYDGAELIKAHESIASAAREIGIDKSGIRDAIHGKQKHAGGFTWRLDEAE